MQKKLNVGDYINRICILVGMWFFIELIQLPVAFIARVDQIAAKLLLIVVYFGMYAGAIAIAWHYYRQYHPEPVGKMTRGNVMLVVIAYVLFMIFQAVMILLSNAVYHQASSENNDSIQRILSSSHLTMVVMLIGIVILSPIVEELVFRGMIVDGLFKTAPIIWPMLVSGVAFAMAHAFSNPFLFLAYGGMGATMVYLYRKTGTLKTNISFHMLNNLIASLGMLPLLFK
ncbi:CPBP family intramembrane metalloprotease [Nicoliella spurrieriana]|uniref:CPBP family intramembrane metalloprotease n=1 Tax=Nicoliella spurrieriana TaxID=2925830 RepID=A0A976RT55_9LACO|nr:type II CAAX endopeptidase family protein [Nicoliella spurrieriana]UQS87357.1 CPBP family intramembrane metalloprotease [Nicoliella spurrieriana]